MPTLDAAPLDPSDPLSAKFRHGIGAQLEAFIADQQPVLAGLGEQIDPLIERARDFTAGGKRLRPAFCVWSYVAARGIPEDPAPLLQAAASLDLLHVSALVHDDVMDRSDTRRGKVAAHRQFEAEHREAGWRGDSEEFGQAGATLLGDLLIMWSVEMLQSSQLPAAALVEAMPLVQAMRTEVTCGQYLDIVAQARPVDKRSAAQAAEEANRVVEYKSARYTVQRPCQFGAALAGADAALVSALGAFGSPLGRAFQFRDDVLGVFGDEDVTGKPAGDDLREGKRTLLLAYAFDSLSDTAAAELGALVGQRELAADGVNKARSLIFESGAAAEVDAMIETNLQAALAALESAELSTDGHRALTLLAHAAVNRTS